MFRQALLGSVLGRAAVRLRDGYELLTAGPERIGTVANDQLAIRLLVRLVERGGTFVDVGAHIGSVIAAVEHHRPDARIVAVEAIPEKAVRLARKFSNVRVEACALADREGKAAFFVDLDRPGYSSLAGGGERLREIEVPLRTLDGLMAGSSADVIKIDVEGAELGVLRGATALIARSRPTILFESGPGEVHGYGKADLWGFFEQAGYVVLVPNRLAHGAPGLSLEAFLDSHGYPRRTTNYFAVALERREAVRNRARRILGLDGRA